MKKKVLAVFLASVMVLTAAGCSGGNQASSEPVEVASVEDLAELNIGVQIGTTGDSAATEAVNEDSQVNRFNKGADAIQALKNGKVDCVVIDSLPAQKFVEANDDLKIVDGIFETEEYAICMKKGNTELRDSFNEALAELKEEGTLDEIQSNYIGDEIGEHPYESPADVDRSNGTLTMATNAEFEPWEYKEGDEIVGIDADIAQAICDKLGYELKATGLNKNAAKYAGMKEKRNMILTMVIAGSLSGLGASFLYLSGIEQWSCAQTAVPAMGFNGIAAAFLGGLNPIGSIFSAFFIQHITSGGSYVDKMVYCAQISDLISAIIIYFCGFVLFFKHCMNRKGKK